MNLNSLKKNENSLLSNSFYLYISQFGDYALSLFLLPIIAKSIGAIEFGKIGLAQTYSVLIVLFLEFGSSLMATREVSRIKRNHRKLNDFIGCMTFFKILLIFPVVIFSLIISKFVPIFTNNQNYILIVFFGAVFQGLSPIWYYQGIEKMKKITLSKLFFRLIGFILIIIYVKSPEDGWKVLASFSLSSTLICLYLYIEIIRAVGFFKIPKIINIKSLLRKSIYSFYITIIPIVYQNICLIALSVVVSPIQLGFFYGASRIYRAFNSLFSPISQSFFPFISSINKTSKREYKSLINAYFKLILLIGLSFFVVINLFSETIISILLGDQFIPANELLRLFSIVLPLTAISNTLGRQWLMSANKDLIYLISHLIASFSAFLTFIFLLENYGIRVFPLSLAFYETTMILTILFFIAKNAK